MKICLVGAGFYGLRLSFALKSHMPDAEVVIFEKNSRTCLGAITNNQHRLHLGFHYPRCKETIRQCVQTFDDFSRIYSDCIEDIEDNYYIIHKDSKVNSDSFSRTMSDFGIYHEVHDIPPEHLCLKNISQFESFFKTNEKKINLGKISSKIYSDAISAGVKISLNREVEQILEDGTIIGKDFVEKFDYVINCSYTNPSLLKSFKTRTKSEICFMGLLRPKGHFGHTFSSTICDGPFSSLYPADKENFTISNVIKTPAIKSTNVGELHDILKKLEDHEKLKICEGIVVESEKYFNNRENFDLIGSYCAIKTKLLEDTNDYRGTFFTQQNRVINIISGKIQACLLLEKELIEGVFS